MVKRQRRREVAPRSSTAPPICVQPGTTTEQNLTDWSRANRIRFTPVVIERLEEVVQRLLRRPLRRLHHRRLRPRRHPRRPSRSPDDHVILPEVISKEPLGPLVRQGDAALRRHRALDAFRC